MKYKDKNIPEITLKFKSGIVEKTSITCSEDSYNVLKKFYDEDTIELTETFVVLYLNMNNKTLGWQKVSQGGIAGTVVDIRLIFATALKCAASSIILSHNHPSGNTTPSKIDLSITRKMIEGGKLLEIKILDHIIISDSTYYSCADNNDL